MSSQLLLQSTNIKDIDKILVQNIIKSFMLDEELDYDIRADSADLLLNLGDDESQNQAREIILLLGIISSDNRTIYNNKQNVHNTSISQSALEILKFICTLKIKDNVNFKYIKDQIIGDEDDTIKDKENNKNKINNLNKNEKNLVKISLNRINLDRVLYGETNSSLKNSFNSNLES